MRLDIHSLEFDIQLYPPQGNGIALLVGSHNQVTGVFTGHFVADGVTYADGQGTVTEDNAFTFKAPFGFDRELQLDGFVTGIVVQEFPDRNTGAPGKEASGALAWGKIQFIHQGPAILQRGHGGSPPPTPAFFAAVGSSPF